MVDASGANGVSYPAQDFRREAGTGQPEAFNKVNNLLSPDPSKLKKKVIYGG